MSEDRDHVILGIPGIGKSILKVESRTRCDCGCGLKDRFEFSVAEGPKIHVDSPEQMRTLIDLMERGYQKLWPSGKRSIQIDVDMAHTILGAFAVCDGEGINGVCDKGPQGEPAWKAASRVVDAIGNAFPELKSEEYYAHVFEEKEK